jgi:surface carbohydrate biosynthesis protein (TIGR04326 family)
VGEFNNKFESVYWGPLVNVLRDSNKKINWIHIYPGDSTLPSLESAKLVIDGYNKKSSDLGNHALVDSFLSLKVVLRAISYWVKVIVADIKVRKYIKNTQINGFPIWPFFKREWNESIYGKSAIYYLLMLSIFEKITKNLSTQKLGVYLYENQRWEYGLLQMWRKFNHSKIVGYAHSSISFWQLRYYHCMKSIYSENILSRPLPCLIATNGASSFNYLKDGGFPEIKMIQIEALRYFHLMDAECNSELPYKNRLNNKGIAEKETFHLLVFGDLSKKRNDLHLKILENAIASSTMKIAATIKPHPGNPVIKEKLISRQITISNQPIHELLNDPKFNVAYVSSSTSSALDAYCAGFKVITSLDGELLNQSPLRDIGGDDVKFIMNEIQLNSILELYVGSVRGKKNHDIFNLDPNLSAWKNLLNISNFSNS